jgi:eukaryotic-like serine/threonine-protein kinase
MKPVEPGETVGDYRVVGAVAARPGVYRAVHVREARRALVRVAPAHDWRAAAIDMLRAARLTEVLHHPGIARVIDRGALADRRPWIASELPDGMTLGELIGRRRLAPVELLPLLRDIAEVLAHAHERGVVHHHLTPASIVMTTGSRAFPICIGDWGDVAIDRDAEPTVYEAPEAEITAKVDVYALGMIAYRALTGAFPLTAPTCVPGVRGALADLILGMLATDPARRLDAAAVRVAASALARPSSQETELEASDLEPTPPPIPRRPRWTPPYPMSTALAAAQSLVLAARKITR